MPSEAVIKTAIERIVRDYSLWTIGVTDDPVRPRSEHGRPYSWDYWDAATEQVARNVESYFIAKGMKGGGGGLGQANYVYIF